MDTVPTILITGFMLAGVGCLACAYVSYLRGKRTLEWPDVEGTVTSSTVMPARSGEYSGYPDVTYEYRVGGEARQGNRISMGMMGRGTPEGAARIVKQYEVGSKVRVCYDPANPSYSVLVRGANMKTVGSLAAGGAMLFVMAGVTMFALYRP